MKTMNHTEVRQKLLFYLDGRLPQLEAQSLKAHLESCADCKAYFIELQATYRLLDENKEQEPGVYFYAGIKNRIDAQRALAVRKWQRLLQPALAVLLLAFGIRFGIWVGDQVRTDLPSTEQAVLLPFDDLSEEPIEEFLLNLE